MSKKRASVGQIALGSALRLSLDGGEEEGPASVATADAKGALQECFLMMEESDAG